MLGMYWHIWRIFVRCIYLLRSTFGILCTNQSMRRKLLIWAIIIAALILIGWWVVFVVSQISDTTPTSDQLQADINQWPISTWSLSLESGHDTISSGNQDQVTTPETVKVFSPPSILLPPVFNLSALQQINKKILEEYGVVAKIEQSTSRADYRTKIDELLAGQQSYDIVMLPTDRINSFVGRGYDIPFSDSIETVFHPIFHPLLLDENISFIPVWIDPLVTYYHESYKPGRPPFTLSDLQRILNKPRRSFNSYIPLLFGISQSNLASLESSLYPYPHYDRLLISYITLATQQRTTQLLSYFLDHPSWHPALLDKFIQTLNQHDDACHAFPKLCILAYDRTDVLFGYQTDRYLLTRYFSHKQASISSFKTTTIPRIDTNYPVTGRGWVLATDSPLRKSSIQWIRWWLNLLLAEEITSPQTMLSAHNITFDRQLVQEEYAYLRKAKNDLLLLTNSVDALEQELQKTKLLEALRGERSITLYLRDRLDDLGQQY